MLFYVKTKTKKLHVLIIVASFLAKTMCCSSHKVKQCFQFCFFVKNHGLWPGQAGLEEIPILPGQASHRNQPAIQPASQELKRTAKHAHAQASSATVTVHTSPLQNTRATTNCYGKFINFQGSLQGNKAMEIGPEATQNHEKITLKS